MAALLPTVLILFYSGLYTLKADAVAQHKRQGMYFTFQIVFVVLAGSPCNNSTPAGPMAPTRYTSSFWLMLVTMQPCWIPRCLRASTVNPVLSNSLHKPAAFAGCPEDEEAARGNCSNGIDDTSRPAATHSCMNQQTHMMSTTRPHQTYMCVCKLIC